MSGSYSTAPAEPEYESRPDAPPEPEVENLELEPVEIDIEDRPARMRQIIVDEHLDRNLLLLVDTAVYDFSQGREDTMLIVDLYILLYRLVPFFYYNALLVDDWEFMYFEYSEICYAAIHWSNSADARTYGQIMAYIISDLAGETPLGDWQTDDEFVENIDRIGWYAMTKADDVMPSLEAIWYQMLYYYGGIEKGYVSEEPYESDPEQYHFEDDPPTQETGYGRGLNELIQEWYASDHSTFNIIYLKLGLTYGVELADMPLDVFVTELADLASTLDGFPDDALLLQAFQHNGDYWVDQIHMMITQSYPAENMAQDWANDVSFPLWSFNELTGDIQMYDFPRLSIINSVLWSTIQNYTTTDQMYKDEP